MGLIGLTAVEVLAFCLGLGLVLAILIVVCNCVSTCWEMFSTRRKKQKVEKLPDDYVDEIHELLRRNRKVCEYDCVVTNSRVDSPQLEYMNDNRLRNSSSSSKVRLQNEDKTNETHAFNEDNNNTNTTNSQATINVSERGEDDNQSKRRTWGRLSSSMFETVLMPSIDTTTTEEDCFEKSPSGSVGNLRFVMKVETTV